MRQQRPSPTSTQQSRLWQKLVGVIMVWLLPQLSGPAFAHSGHDEAPIKLAVMPASSQQLQVRGSTHSETFEVVLVWQPTDPKHEDATSKHSSPDAQAKDTAQTTGTLQIYLDDYATNQAVQGATIEVTASNTSGHAKEIAAGLYQIDMPLAEREALTLLVQAGEQMDLLAVDLAKPQSANAEPHAHGYLEDFPAYWPSWLTAVIGFGLLVLLGLWQRKQLLAWVRGA